MKVFLIRMILSALLICQLSSAVAANQTSKSSLRLHGEIDMVAYACAAGGITLSSPNLPCVITAVRNGSPAFYAGASENDKVLSANIVADKLILLIKRNGKEYSIQLNTQPALLTKLVPMKQASHIDLDKIIDAKNKKSPDAKCYEQLSKFDIAILIDMSASMQYTTKPGGPITGSTTIQDEDGEFHDVGTTTGISKWGWCTDNVETLAQGMEKYTNAAGITLVLFNDQHNIERHCSSEKIVSIVAHEKPHGATNISAPLQDVLDSYQKNAKQDKPLLVVIMTDGIPTQGDDIQKVIALVAQRIHSPEEIKLLFLIVGYGQGDREFLNELSGLRSSSERGLLRVVTFDELENLGLADALTSAINARTGSALEIK